MAFMREFTGEVKYEAREPRDFGNGPRINVVVAPDDGAEDVKIWGNPTDSISSLKRGDRVVIGITERGAKKFARYDNGPSPQQQLALKTLPDDISDYLGATRLPSSVYQHFYSQDWREDELPDNSEVMDEMRREVMARTGLFAEIYRQVAGQNLFDGGISEGRRMVYDTDEDGNPIDASHAIEDCVHPSELMKAVQAVEDMTVRVATTIWISLSDSIRRR